MTMLPFGQIAPISRRAVAYLIDAVIAGGLAIVLSVVLALIVSFSGGIEASLVTLAIGGPVVGLLLLGWFVVYTWMQSGTGSIGMRAQGLTLAREADGAPLGFGRALVRNLIFGLAAGIVVGYFTPLFDGSGRFQGWHDKVAKSVMLDARVAKSGRPTAPAAGEVGRGSDLRASPAGAAAPAIPGLAPTPSAYAPAPTASRFAAPSTPAAQPSAAPAWPSAAQAPAAAPAAPAAAPFPSTAAPAFPAAAPAAPVGADDELIAFVPGITQDAPPRRTAAVDPASEAPGPQPPAPQAPAPQAPAPRAPAPQAQTPAPQAPAPQAQAPAAPAPTPAADPWAAPAPAAPLASAPEASTPEPALSDVDIESTRISIPGHRLVLTWDDGTRTPVSRRTIFGRNPAPEEGAAVVAVRDETLSLSKTHFEAAAEVSGGWVLDRHSTNGTTIVRDGQRLACPPGQRVPVRLGDAIEIGDRIVTIGGYA